jgi:uncharacterized membrane protein YdjX (TVP38/TMEM64 family)
VLGVALLILIVGSALAGFVWMTLLGGALTVAETVQAISGQIDRNRMSALILFGISVFLIQLVSLPGGTIAVLSGGFLFGAPLAAGVYYLAQLAAAPVVFGAVRLGISPKASEAIHRLARRKLPPRLAGSLRYARNDSIMTIIVFRLAPVLTSTFVPALAAALGLPFRALMIGSALVSWIKPSITASIGAAARSLTEITQSPASLAKAGTVPLLMIFAGALGLLAVRLYRQRHRSTPP